MNISCCEIMRKLDCAFYDRKNVVAIAKDLLGKLLVTNFDNVYTAGRIVETEAYAGEVDRASHAYGGRKTPRTAVMYGDPGTAYVYLCYGIHQMFNVVTNSPGIPHAILIRAIEPVQGISEMLARTGKASHDYTLTKGPGNVAKAFGIFTYHTGRRLDSDDFFIADEEYDLKKSHIFKSPRIGVQYAGTDAALLYRFSIKANPYVSGKKGL